MIELSALLHDVLDKKYVPESLSRDPYAFFLPIFEDLNVKHPSVGLLAEDGKRARLIADVVTNVSWSTEKKLRQEGKWGAWHDGCVELHCVQDADRLDAIGAFGTRVHLELTDGSSPVTPTPRNHEMLGVHCHYLKVGPRKLNNPMLPDD